MALSINNNLMAHHTAGKLGTHYARLSAVTRRLSSGLRVSTAADDAAGLAIRELMRADISSLNQGIRNANDAISMIQTADGALAVIDEKLIRMKELAEQAATGTYDSTQRLIIDSEFQQMALEIDRIANATDFNGIKLLDGSLRGEHDGSDLNATGKMKIHFGTGNNSAEDYYYVEIGDCTLAGLGLAEKTAGNGATGPTSTAQTWEGTFAHSGISKPPLNDVPGGTVTDRVTMLNYQIETMQTAFPQQGKWYVTYQRVVMGGLDMSAPFDKFRFIIPKGAKNVVINAVGDNDPGTNGDNDIQVYTMSGMHLVGTPKDDISQPGITAGLPLKGPYDGSNLNAGPATYDPTGNTLAFSTYNGMTFGYSGDADRHDAVPNDGTLQTWMDYEVLTIDSVTEDLVFYYPGLAAGYIKVYWDLPDEAAVPAPPAPGTPPGPGLVRGDIISIKTQQLAQEALPRLDEAMVKKDNVRAHLGAMQNRLENTVTNLSIQAENLQAAESQISDVDVATEMTEFVRSRILAQASAAMLSQANMLPRMLAGVLDR